jgi:hypothetical protein
MTIIVKPNKNCLLWFKIILKDYFLQIFRKYFQFYINLRGNFLWLLQFYNSLSMLWWYIQKFCFKFITNFQVRAIIKSKINGTIIYFIQEAMFRKLLEFSNPFFNITTIISFTVILKAAYFFFYFEVDLFLIFFWRYMLIIWELNLLYFRS